MVPDHKSSKLKEYWEKEHAKAKLHSGLGMEKDTADWKQMFEDTAELMRKTKMELTDKQKLEAYALYK